MRDEPTKVQVGRGGPLCAFPILTTATVTGAGSSFDAIGGRVTFQAVGAVSTSTGAATIAVQVSNDNANWLTLGTITLALTTTSSSDGFASDAPWAFVRGNVTAISGTGAAVSLIVAH
jgi:hypothetical protein